MQVDVLLFGAHPDDIEWGVGGTAILLQQKGVALGLVDLTRGEMGSRGTPDVREAEAQRVAEFLGGAPRLNLQLPDTELTDTPQTRKQVAQAMREFRPKLVLAPYWRDRHPDHAAAGCMVRNAALYSILKKLESPHAPHKPLAVLYYLLHHFARPSLVVDITGVYQRKQAMLQLHESQFAKTAEQFGVVAHGLGDYLYALESRDRYFGSLIGTRHGEALVLDQPLDAAKAGPLLSLLA